MRRSSRIGCHFAHRDDQHIALAAHLRGYVDLAIDRHTLHIDVFMDNRKIDAVLLLDRTFADPHSTGDSPALADHHAFFDNRQSLGLDFRHELTVDAPEAQ